jgi:hypothetical protein
MIRHLATPHRLAMSATIAMAVLIFGIMGLRDLGGPNVHAQGSGPAVDWWVIAGGGAPSTGTGVALNGTLGQPIIGPSSSGTAGLVAGYWASCVAAAAVVPVATVALDTVNAANVVLTWPADPANARYQVWISTDPYFDPDHPGGVTPIVTADATYTDIGAAADLVNHFYVVRGLNPCGVPSANSGRTGEFTFGLTPGVP